MDIQSHHYYSAKRSPQTRTAGDFKPAEPHWLRILPQIYNLTTPFSILIDQLPTVRATHNNTIIKNYYTHLVAELVKIYVYRLRIVELSDTISEKDKPASLDRLINECKQYITDLAGLLNYGDANIVNEF